MIVIRKINRDTVYALLIMILTITLSDLLKRLNRVGSAFISKIRRFLTTEACKLLIHALVTFRLDYCNSIIYCCNQSILQRLQLIQNYAARLVYRIPKFSHITPYLMDLHWLPVQARIQFKLLSIVFKCIHGTGPQYLSELLCRRTTRPGLRSANSFKL